MATPRKPAPAAKKTAAKAVKATKKAVKKTVATTAKVPPKKAAPTPPRAASASKAKKAAPTKKTAATSKATTVKKTAPTSAAPSKQRTQANKAVNATPKQTTTATPAPAKAAKAAPLDKFLEKQRDKLLEERAEYMDKAEQLKAEADQLARENEPGDIEFGEEGGEGVTTNIDRELDLVLSAQARAAVDEIDQALNKITNGTYGVCEHCGQNIPRARLEALPYAALCVQCKSGGLSRR